MCRQVCYGAMRPTLKCCCAGTLAPEDEIRMLEAMQSVVKIRLALIDRRIQDLRKKKEG